ncbi:MAG: nucleotidyltransferase family protein [Deltaproteobacteria bacterium]
MDQSKTINHVAALLPKEAVQDVSRHLEPCGTSDELLTYVQLVLQDESPLAPEASLDEWSSLLTFLRAHWIIPLLYRIIGSLPSECRPPEAMTNELRQDFLVSVVRSLHMERQLGEILEAFREQGVRALVLRGPALAFSLYPDPAMRPSGDLDLLVMPEQVIEARGILESLGYTCLAKRFETSRDFFREECFIHQKNPGNKSPVDLHWVHWELHPFFRGSEEVDIQDLFQRSWRVEAPTLTFETLHPVDYLIHSAIHLVMIHKNEMRLSWIYDTALLAQHLQVPDDWERLQERSVAWRARLPLERCLKMAQVWAGLELPEGFADFSTWPPPTEDEAAVWTDTMDHHWVTILLKRSLANPSILLKRVPSLLRLLFPHPDIVRFCYPASSNWLLPISYVRRWFRWIDDLVINRIGESKQKG